MSLPALAADEARRVAARATDELDVLLADTEAWVNTDSPSGDVARLDALAAAMGHRMARLGLDVELVPHPEGLHLHAVLEGHGTSRIALVGHHDTVYPAGTVALRPFRRDGDRLIGPGVADMKGGLVVGAHTMRLLADGPRPFGRIELVSVPDEEPRTAPFGTLARVGGFDAAFCLECGRPGGAIVTARKGAVWAELQAHGRAAHAGVAPDDGRNAVVALAREALRIAALHRCRPGLTVQVTRLIGGDVKNSVPAYAELGIDLRAATEVDLDWAVGEVCAAGPADGIRFESSVAGTPPLERTPAVAALAATAQELGRLLGLDIEETSTGGVSDGCWTAHAGITTLDGLGPVGALDHTPDEWADAPSFATRCGILAGLVAAV
jgi:glutamate carboxypeptidase